MLVQQTSFTDLSIVATAQCSMESTTTGTGAWNGIDSFEQFGP